MNMQTLKYNCEYTHPWIVQGVVGDNMADETSTNKSNEMPKMSRKSEVRVGIYIAIFTILGVVGMLFLVFSASDNSSGALVVNNTYYEYTGIGLLVADIVFMIVGAVGFRGNKNASAA